MKPLTKITKHFSKYKISDNKYVIIINNINYGIALQHFEKYKISDSQNCDNNKSKSMNKGSDKQKTLTNCSEPGNKTKIIISHRKYISKVEL